jgi:hypothetical protein
MNKLTAEDFQRHLKAVVDPNTLGKVSLDKQQIACDEMASALNNKQQKTERGR